MLTWLKKYWPLAILCLSWLPLMLFPVVLMLQDWGTYGRLFGAWMASLALGVIGIAICMLYLREHYYAKLILRIRSIFSPTEAMGYLAQELHNAYQANIRVQKDAAGWSVPEQNYIDNPEAVARRYRADRRSQEQQTARRIRFWYDLFWGTVLTLHDMQVIVRPPKSYKDALEWCKATSKS